MATFRLAGILSIAPIISTALLLTVSFFVLLAIRKVETQSLKVFGYVIAVLLWIAAALVLSVGIYTISTGKHPMMHQMKQERMQGQMMKTPMQSQQTPR